MVGIQGIGPFSGPANSKQVQGREKSSDTARAAATDGLDISLEAQEASAVSEVAAQAPRSEIRAERIAQARENIEQGVYRIQEVVLQVADRLERFVT